MSIKHLIWIIPVSLTVCWVATMTRDANIETEKQQAFMMKACVDAGGDWLKSGWTPAKECKRPKP